jgi:hypothetical protein
MKTEEIAEKKEIIERLDDILDDIKMNNNIIQQKKTELELWSKFPEFVNLTDKWKTQISQLEIENKENEVKLLKNIKNLI